MRVMLAVLTMLMLPATSATAAVDYPAIVAAALDRQIIPGFRTFAARAATLVKTTDTFCHGPDARGLDAVRADFNGVMDAWQKVQHVGIGPGDDFNRSQRVQFWPDKKNSGDRQMLTLLKERNAERLEGARMIVASVAVQGLPAFEMLLFGKGQPERLLAKDDDAAFRCRTVKAIAANLTTIGGEFVAEWEKPDGYRAAMLNAGSIGSRYTDHRQVASQLFNALHSQLQAIAEVKLGHPLGATVDEARPGRSESWRAKRSLRNVLLDLVALRAMFVDAFLPAMASAGKAAEGNRFVAAVDRAIATARQFHGPMEDEMTRPDGWKRLSALKTEIKTAARNYETEIGPVLDLQIGFNALDGD
jgi:predicted lipoprotein